MRFTRTILEEVQRRVTKLEQAFKYPSSAEDDGLGGLHERLLRKIEANDAKFINLYIALRAEHQLLLDYLSLEIVDLPTNKVVRKVKK